MAVGGAGAIAGLMMLLPLFPIDTVMSRLQAIKGKHTVSETFKLIHGKGGMIAFFPGIGPALLRAVPANAAAILGWEMTRLILGVL